MLDVAEILLTLYHADFEGAAHCILLEIGDFKILTDPTLDRGGRLYYHGYEAVSRKTDDPALPDIDLVLLSHHQHKDNFDKAGKAFTVNVPQVLSTRKLKMAIENDACARQRCIYLRPGRRTFI